MTIKFSAVALTALFAAVSFTAQGAPTKKLEAEQTPKQLQLASGSAMVVDLETQKILYANNPNLVVPIASISKLMTAMVVLDAKLPMDEILAVSIVDTQEMKGVYSRVRLGSELSRKQLLLLALMSSENRAAATLAHYYPGGQRAFIAAMNIKAHSLGMTSSHFVEPTGLSKQNVSTARDLTRLLSAAKQYPLLGELSTTPHKDVTFHNPNYSLSFYNTDHLINNSRWDIQLTKTGYTDEAGHCLVLLTKINKRPVAVVVLDAFGKYTHFADMTRLRNWMETGKSSPIPEAAKNYRKQKDVQGHPARVAQN